MSQAHAVLHSGVRDVENYDRKDSVVSCTTLLSSPSWASTGVSKPAENGRASTKVVCELKALKVSSSSVLAERDVVGEVDLQNRRLSLLHGADFDACAPSVPSCVQAQVELSAIGSSSLVTPSAAPTSYVDDEEEEEEDEQHEMWRARIGLLFASIQEEEDLEWLAWRELMECSPNVEADFAAQAQLTSTKTRTRTCRSCAVAAAGTLATIGVATAVQFLFGC